MNDCGGGPAPETSGLVSLGTSTIEGGEILAVDFTNTFVSPDGDITQTFTGTLLPVP